MMAAILAETEAGRAMLINLAMTQADLGRALLTSERQFIALISEPWPHYVHYRGRKPVHCPPDHFGFIGKYGPSHCDWIVPGTYG